MAKFKPPRRLFGNREVTHSYPRRHNDSAGAARHSIARPDGLQHVEFAFAALARRDSQLDDASILEAVQMFLKGSAPGESTSPKVAELRALIGATRETRTNVPDREWEANLRTVAQSVRRHSKLDPGERSYIEFILRYVS